MAKNATGMLWGCMIAYLVVSLVFICLRLYSKRIAKSKFYLDDWVLVSSFVSIFLLPLSTGYNRPNTQKDYPARLNSHYPLADQQWPRRAHRRVHGQY